MDGAAGFDGAAVVLEQRLESEADPQDRDPAEHPVEDGHHVAGVRGVTGAGREADEVGLRGEHVVHADRVAEDSAAVAGLGERIDEVVDEAVVVVDEDDVRHRMTSRVESAASAMALSTA